ncbi:hypothetical protein [Sphingobacterium bovistauri]|uniref:Membrane or secreted protein n=1 Tax=Sphingobacterium bovistauri TaxID=2781959 RepID=A0ABS7Z4V4_9SPHI|nr:hypothetical protein [Sphingobacterium bovistauri]MCA5005195.1 hypothetical protein [Sphingobacterium bovistauri]
MRNTIILVLLIICSISCAVAQNPTGVYIATNNNDKHLLLIADGYITHTIFSASEYKNTQGGTYKIANNELVVNCEFDDKNPSNIGKEHHFPIRFESETLYLDNTPFQKQAKSKQDLDGLWRITGRQNNQTVNTIKRADRKTIKLLVDGYFQWIAINPIEKGFYGTGGGKYTFQNRNYQENILFFSRDNNRVGATLNFSGEIKNNEWHHSGKSSKGDPIYEIWSRDN